MDDARMGNDLSIMFGYLDNYKKELSVLILAQVEAEYAKQIVWEARISEIERLQKKYKKLIEFVDLIEGEENGL